MSLKKSFSNMVRIDIHQPIACYRIPEIGNPILSYPLVPPSTVYGLLRYITGYLSINKDNAKIAISGKYEGKTRHIVINHITTKGDKGRYKTNKVPVEELYNVSHHIHIDSPYEQEIEEAICNAHRMGRREDVITSINCYKVEVITQKTMDMGISKISNNDERLYVPFNSKIQGIGIFKVPIDSDKALLDNGHLKMCCKKLLYISAFKLYGICNEVAISKDKEGKVHLLYWLNG